MNVNDTLQARQAGVLAGIATAEKLLSADHDFSHEYIGMAVAQDAVKAAFATIEREPAREMDSSPTPTIAPTGDLVRRLRERAVALRVQGMHGGIEDEAAAHIEQLEKERDTLLEIIARRNAELERYENGEMTL